MYLCACGHTFTDPKDSQNKQIEFNCPLCQGHDFDKMDGKSYTEKIIRCENIIKEDAAFLTNMPLTFSHKQVLIKRIEKVGRMKDYYKQQINQQNKSLC